MITIIPGITKAEFVSDMNANFVELAANLNVAAHSFITLTVTMSEADMTANINRNFRLLSIWNGITGSNFINGINANFQKMISRFMDNRIENIFGATCMEPTVLLSDDFLRMEIWSKNKYGYTDDGVNFSNLVAIDIPDGYYTGHIAKDGNIFYMTMAYWGGTNYDRINLFSSSNGINWTNLGIILTIGSEGTWNSTAIANAFIWKEDNGTWSILYEANKIGGPYSICLATANTVTGPWTKYAGNPVLSEGSFVGHPTLVRINNAVTKFGGYYYMYYQYNEALATENLHRAKSTDLHTWILEGGILDYRKPPMFETTNGDQATAQFKGKSYLFNTNNMNGGGADTHIDVCVDNRPFAEMLALYP